MKKFLRSPWGIVCIVAVALVLLAGIAFGGYQYWLYQQPKFQNATLELGTKNIPADVFFTQYAKPEEAVLRTDLSSLTAAGEYPVTLCHGRKEETVTLTLVDTTPPVAEFVTKRVEAVGYVPKAEDFVTSVTDLSDTTVFFMDTPVIPEDYAVLELTVVVEDVWGNRTQQNCALTYSWIYEEVTLELGQTLTPAHILPDPEKDAGLLDMALLEQISGAGVGEYTVECTSGGQTLQCKVTVVDTTAPTLELKPVERYENGTATLEHFVVKAEDLSGEVELQLLTELKFGKLGTYPVQIQAKDIHGNTVILETELRIVPDTTGPAIYGLGTMYVEKHSSPDYMGGVTAYDSKDGSCTVSCNADKVDLTKAGTYYATYTSVDRSGNQSSASRKIVVNHDQDDRAALVATIAQKVGSDPLALRTYIRNEIAYINNWGGDDPVWYGFTQWAGNCYVHAVCLQALLDYYGYETQMIWVEDQSHYWLIIRLDGKWWHIDGTPGPVHTKYDQPMNDEQRLETLKGRKWDTTKWPPCG